MKHSVATFVVICLGLGLGCGGGEVTEESQPTAKASSVIVIAVDGLRADALSPEGAPALSALAAEGVVFTQAWTQSPAMWPALASMLTGMYPTTHGMVGSGDRLTDEVESLAEAAQMGGVETGLFIQGMPEGDLFGLDQGFAAAEVGELPGQAAARWVEGLGAGPHLVVVAGWSAAGYETEAGPSPPDGYSGRVADVILSRMTDEPKMLSEDDLGFARVAYADRVRHLDERIGGLVESLRAAGELDTTTLVVTGLTGLAMQEHGDLFGESLYPAVTHVPLIIRPAGGGAGTTVDKVVELVDLAPTIAAMLDVRLAGAPQGSDLADIMAGGGAPPYIAFAETDADDGQRLVVMDGMAMVKTGERAELFDLAADPLALTDVSAEYPERVTVLTDHLGAWAKMVAAVSLDPERRSEELDDETLEQLKSLGYIQ
jgi:arylsulfatase A-like enzyme